MIFYRWCGNCDKFTDQEEVDDYNSKCTKCGRIITEIIE